MEKKDNSTDRLSFAQPNAESTMNGTFHWGRKEFYNSSNSQERKTNKSPNSNILSKIDARVYTDVQSRGLAARVVKYHENSARLNRSMSMNNLCIKNSPLSLKHPSKQPELAYKAAKQNFSMTHIAPPDKSLFYGNTLSGLLRSNSVITLQQNDDELSSENRPIIHPPGTETEFQPSVLEVLKEISRKRINNEVLQDSDEADTTKKYCSRIDNNFNGITNEYRIQQMQLQTPATYKRQRESAACQLDVKSQQPELPSPEQKSKRRYCNYNNDITSSLSSSAKSTAYKRKLNEHDGYKRQEKLLRYQPDMRLCELTSSLSYKNQMPITPLPNTPQTATSNDLPLPAFVEKSISEPAATVNLIEKNVETLQHTEKPRLTLFNKNYETKNAAEFDAPKLLDNEDDNAYVGINFVKPKKTTTSIGSSASSLVLQRTQKSKLALMLSGLRGELYLGEDLDSVEQHQTNVPKKNETQSIATNITTPTIANNTVSEAAVDKTDSSKQTTPIASSQQTTATATAATVSFVVSTASTTPNSTTMTASTKPATTATKITSPLTGIKLTPNITLNTLAPTSAQSPITLNTAVLVSTSNSEPSVSKPAFSFGLTPAPTTTASMTFGTPALSSAANSNSNFAASITANAQTHATLPTTNTATVAALSASSIVTPPAFNFTAKTQANSIATTSVTTSSTTTAPFTFGGLQSSTNSETTKPANTQTAPPQFNFTANNNNNAGGFNFGTTITTLAETAKTNTPKPAVGFTFGNTNATEAKTASTLNSFGNASSSLQFGEQTQQHKDAASTNALFAKPIEQQTANATNNQQQSVGFFSLSAAANTVSTTEASKTSNTFSFSNAATSTKTFSFGSNANEPTPPTNTEATNSTNLFATLGNTPSPAFSFGAKTNANTLTTAAKPMNAFSFGSGSTTNSMPASNEAQKAANAFSFSSATPENAFANQNNPNQGNVFANNSTQSSAFVFGNNTNANNKTNPTTTTPVEPAKTTNVFGASTTNQSNAFSFGSIAQSSNVNAFGSAVPSNGAFNFSASNNNNNNNNKNSSSTLSTNDNQTTSKTFGTFGSSTTSSGGFSFGGNSTATAGSNALAKSTPTFGVAATNNTPSGGGFVFGASNNNAKPADAANIFASSNPSMTPQATGNLFAGTNTQAASNAFGVVSSSVFGGNNATNATTKPSTTAANLFTIPPSAGNDRPIRRATRRLAKS